MVGFGPWYAYQMGADIEDINLPLRDSDAALLSCWTMIAAELELQVESVLYLDDDDTTTDIAFVRSVLEIGATTRTVEYGGFFEGVESVRRIKT